MAFCPNCGTPNTDQAEKCVACSFELAPKQQKAKFKGTIMMSGIKATGAPPGLGTAPTEPPPEVPPSDEPASTPSSPPSPASVPPPARNPNFQKTMLGHMAPPPVAPGAPGARPAAPSTIDAHGATVQGPGVGFTAPTPTGPAGAPQRTTFGSSTGTTLGPAAVPAYGEPGSPGVPRRDSLGGSHTGSFDSTVPPDAPGKPNPGKVVVIGCVGALAVSCIVISLLVYALGPKLRAWFSNSSDTDAEAVAWQASMTQALTQVTALCQTDCQQASVFFHPQKQAALLSDAKLLTPARVNKLGDVATTKAEMLDRTDDRERAIELGLDPQQCARVIAGTAKVISCSVPDPSGPRSVLRIVQLSGIGTL